VGCTLLASLKRQVSEQESRRQTGATRKIDKRMTVDENDHHGILVVGKKDCAETGIERKIQTVSLPLHSALISAPLEVRLYLATSYPKMSVSNTHIVNASLVAVKKVLTRRTRQRPYELLHQNHSLNHKQASTHATAKRSIDRHRQRP